MMPRPDAGHALALGAVSCAVGLAYATAIHPLLSLGLVGGAAVGYLVLAYAPGMLLVLVAILPWEGVLAYPSEQVSVVKIAGVLLGGAYLLRVAASRAPVQSTKTVLVVGAFLALVLLSLMFSPDLPASIAKTLRYILFAIFFFLLVQLAPDRAMVVRVLKTFVLSMTVAAAYGTVLALTVEGAFAAGPVEDPNDFAYLLVTSLPLAVYLALEERPRGLWAFCVVVLFAGMLATVSRGALAGLAGVLVWAVATRRLPLRGLVAAGALVGAVVILGLALAAPADAPPARAVPAPARIVMALGCLALALVPAQVLLSEGPLRESARAFARGDCATAIDRALRSTSVFGVRPEPFIVLGYCDVRIGRPDLALRALTNAVRRDPDNWEAHYGLALVRAAAGQDPRPRLRIAQRLNPLDPLVYRATRLFATNDPQQWKRRALTARLPIQ